MISSIRIEGYRGFDRFEMSDLGRVNLLVGTNNSGKTSVLEAIYLLSSAADPAALWQLLWRRGERLAPALMVTPECPLRRSPVELDVAHLFYGHEAQPGARLRISARNQAPERVVEYTVIELPVRDQQEIFNGDEEGPLTSRLALEASGNPRPAVAVIPLTRAGGIFADAIDLPARRARFRSTEGAPSHFITTESFTGDELVASVGQGRLDPI